MAEYINRKDAIKAIGEEPENWSDTPEEIQEHSDWEKHIDAINAVPSADVAPMVHGKWEKYKIPNIVCCSVCDYGTGYNEESNYCPNCGAKMDGKD